MDSKDTMIASQALAMEKWNTDYRTNDVSEIEFLCAYDLTYVTMCLKLKSDLEKKICSPDD
jgi:hypothetical protein